MTRFLVAATVAAAITGAAHAEAAQTMPTLVRCVDVHTTNDIGVFVCTPPIG